MMRSLACYAALATAVHALAPRRAATRRLTRRQGAPKDGPIYTDLPRDVEPINTDFLEEEAPISWGAEGWNWGSATGAAHDKAALVRSSFQKRHRRSSFMSWAKCGTVDASDLKMALALSCQKARNEGYDKDGKWESLMDAMANAEFMDAKCELIDYLKLAMAVNERLPASFTYDEFLELESEGLLEEYPVAVCARALEHLDFVENGL